MHGTECMRPTRPASAPGLQAAPPPLTLGAHERPKPAANDLDILQSELAKFDLGLESVDITQRSGRDDKAPDGITKTVKREINIIHFSHSPQANTNTIQLFEF
jgi:hypothetical protein